MAACLVAVFAVMMWRYPDQPGPARAEAATVEIPPGAGIVGIKELLAQARIVHDDPRFVLLVKLTGVARQLKAGEYAFAPGMTPRAVLALLLSGRVVQHAITLAEGLTLAQAADVVSSGGWGSREDFLRLAADSELLGRFGVNQATAEGYLFPDTYFFPKRTPLRTVITAMLRRMDRVLAEEGVGNGGTTPSSPPPPSVPDNETVPAVQAVAMTRHEVLTLASIIEKETALPGERPLVARVFLNRLRLGMKLQADPTVIYGLAKFGVPLTKADLETETPYNTYTNRGLPVGPICSPGRTAIAAVIHPSLEDYTYFVAQGDGTHYFSKNLDEHNSAVARYRKKRLSNKE